MRIWYASRKQHSPAPTAKLIAPGLPNKAVLALRGISLPLPAQIELSPSRIYTQTLTTSALCSPKPRIGYAIRLKAHATQPIKIHIIWRKELAAREVAPMPVMIAQNLRRAAILI